MSENDTTKAATPQGDEPPAFNELMPENPFPAIENAFGMKENPIAALEGDVVDDLLKALREVSQALEWQAHGSCRGFSDNLLPNNVALSLARAAIAKAEGAGQ